MLYSKTLNTNTDYDTFSDGTQHAKNIRDLLQENKVTARFEHPNRAFEYGVLFEALRSNDTKEVLDIGGGGSVFDVMCAWVDMNVKVVDPGDCSDWVKQQNAVLADKPNIEYVQENFFDYSDRNKYDAVVCVSTIEHVPGYDKYGDNSNNVPWDFYNNMLAKVSRGGLFALTTDFHPSGEQQVDGHIRTYNKENMLEFIERAEYKHKRHGYKFEVYGDGYDYDYFAEDVNNYTFASLVLKRVK